jgi:hypothetical protein
VIFDATENVTYKMPKDGYYFDLMHSPLADATSIKDIDRYMDQIENIDKPSPLDKSHEDLAKKAKELPENTDYLLVGLFGGHILQAAQQLRG